MKRKINLAFPNIKLGQVQDNKKIIQNLIDQGQEAKLIVFPPLSLTGDGLGSLFSYPPLLEENLKEIKNLESQVPLLIGLALAADEKVFSVMAYMDQGKIQGYFPLKSKEEVFADPLLFPQELLADIELFDLDLYMDDNFRIPNEEINLPASGSLYISSPQSYSISGGIQTGSYLYKGEEKLSGDFKEGLVQLELELDRGELKIRSFEKNEDYIDSPLPFLRKDRDYERVLDYQARAYGSKLIRTGLSHSLIGVSGGLDSTWALIAAKRAHELMGLPQENIHCIVMPGFGSSEDTMDSALGLLEELDFEPEIISIDAAVMQHFKDLNHDPEVLDLVYENSQARERTQILMDLANKYHGLVIGTGDMSEIALGWSTYNGDQMSMYGINASLPKTLIKDLIYWYALKSHEGLKARLLHILGRPISPELLPPDKDGAIVQKTEEVVGRYEIIDLILYNFLKNKSIKEIDKKLEKHYPQLSKEERKDNLLNFFRRFVYQQFKRTASPDGVRLTDPSLLDFDMAGDLDPGYFIREIEKL